MNAPSGATRRLVYWVHWSLLGGLAASTLLLALGLYLVFDSGQPRAEAVPPVLESLPTRAFGGDGVATLDLGLVLLMLTPVARVVVLAVGWSFERNWRFASVAFAVLALLSLSVMFGVG